MFYVGFMNIDQDAMTSDPNVQILVLTNEPDPVSFSVMTTAVGVITTCMPLILHDLYDVCVIVTHSLDDRSQGGRARLKTSRDSLW